MKKLIPIVMILVMAVTGFIYYFNEDKQIGSTTIENVENIPQNLQLSKSSGIRSNGEIDGVVNKVTDGDTIEVRYNKKNYKVRLLDVDTPESVKQGVPVQGYSKEASEFTRKIALGKDVKLIFEKETKDRYGRLLAHVFIKNQQLSYLNGLLVYNGFARVEVLSPNRVYKSFFESLQQKAIYKKKGFWAMPENLRPFIKVKNSFIPAYKVK